MRPPIGGDIPQRDDMFRPQALDEGRESVTSDLAYGEIHDKYTQKSEKLGGFLFVRHQGKLELAVVCARWTIKRKTRLQVDRKLAVVQCAGCRLGVEMCG
ncbi:hypothetical protein CKAH01_03533 [Colletotrichum kahawae]|uniref:Uncharacterized protein n=1 Tax=Colletotrichum kahawae TaxID=34407 RepID=A0AAE0DCC6_COLKA|nr:hypothetical protein CKAH01_03533 [Colletotrichum kahawae]